MRSSPQRPIGFPPSAVSSRVNREVVEQHAEQAASLWSLRDRAVRSPQYRLKELARLDERVEAHLDGLRIAGDVGWQEVSRLAADAEPGAIFAAGVVALEDSGRMHVDAVWALAEATDGGTRQLTAAFG